MLNRLPPVRPGRLELPLRPGQGRTARHGRRRMPVADKPDSQELCFAAGGYRQF